MSDWKDQITHLIDPALRASKATDIVLIDRGVIGQTGAVAMKISASRTAVIFADDAGFAAAGPQARASLEQAGFAVQTCIKPASPLPKASVDEAQPFVDALRAAPDALPVSVGSGVINDLTKYASFQCDKRYLSVATAASMDGYTSAGAPLAQDGFKVTIPTRAPVALIADLDIIAHAPAEMTGWGYGDLAGKSPAGGDWILADLAGIEPIDTTAYPMVQDNLAGWLADPQALAARDFDAMARLFIGLTAVGFAMEFHESSRPASGADHQIAHIWEMEGLNHKDRKVSHGAAVAVGCTLTLGLYDWLIAQDLTTLDAVAVANVAPDIAALDRQIDRYITDPRIAARAKAETREKWVDKTALQTRLARIAALWPATQRRLQTHLYRQPDMARMLRHAGAPTTPAEIGVTPDHLRQTLFGAPFIRSRYTILDLLHDIGQFETAANAVLAGANAPENAGAAA